MVAASRATSVPDAPIATPMSARRSAGASFTPSPVIATVWPWARSASTTRSFVSGSLRATMSSGLSAGARRRARAPQGLDLGAGEHAGLSGDDPDLARHRLRGQRVIAGDHDDPDAGPSRAGDGIGDVRAQGGPGARPGRGRRDRLGHVAVGLEALSRDALLGEAEHPQPGARVALERPPHRPARVVVERPLPGGAAHAAASLEQLERRTLDVEPAASRPARCQGSSCASDEGRSGTGAGGVARARTGRHPDPHRGPRRPAAARFRSGPLRAPSRRLRDGRARCCSARRCARSPRRLASPSRGTARIELLAVGPKPVHRHAALGERAGLVGADHVGRTEGLDRGQALDERPPPSHAPDADRQSKRDRRQQALGDVGHQQADGEYQRVREPEARRRACPRRGTARLRRPR